MENWDNSWNTSSKGSLKRILDSQWLHGGLIFGGDRRELGVDLEKLTTQTKYAFPGASPQSQDSGESLNSSVILRWKYFIGADQRRFGVGKIGRESAGEASLQ